MLLAFEATIYTCESIAYSSYNFKRIKKQIRLFKGCKNIGIWNIENNNIEISINLSPSEKRIAKKFCDLPNLAEQYYQIKIKKGTLPTQKPDKYTDASIEIEQLLCTISDSELTKERLTKLIEQLAEKYVWNWYGDCNQDHYNDHYVNYLSQSQCNIKTILMNLEDNRVLDLLAKPRDKVYWKRYKDEDLFKMLKVVPLYAQREGNLFTINKEEHSNFEQFCAKGYKYALDYILNLPLRDFVPEAFLEICWWEKNMKDNNFFIPALDIKPTPSTYREFILEVLQPKLQKSTKPSRIKLKIYFDENYKKGNVFPFVCKRISQLGIITWMYSSN